MSTPTRICAYAGWLCQAEAAEATARRQQRAPASAEVSPYHRVEVWIQPDGTTQQEETNSADDDALYGLSAGEVRAVCAQRDCTAV